MKAVFVSNFESENHLSCLETITKKIKKSANGSEQSHHVWIDKIQDREWFECCERIRADGTIQSFLEKEFPNYQIANVREVDEVYYAVSPKNAQNSDQSLVRFHYDSPGGWLFPDSCAFLRVIVACNPNSSVSTKFPNDRIQKTLTTGDYVCMDYNKTLHCAEGQIPPGKHRAILKLHFMATRNKKHLFAKLIKVYNVQWTLLSRFLMRVSNNPQNIVEMIIGKSVNVSRVSYNWLYQVMIGTISLVFGDGMATKEKAL